MWENHADKLCAKISKHLGIFKWAGRRAGVCVGYRPWGQVGEHTHEYACVQMCMCAGGCACKHACGRVVGRSGGHVGRQFSVKFVYVVGLCLCFYHCTIVILH